MVQAHRKWEKSHGDSLRDQMEWYFDDILKGDTEKAIKVEVDRHLEEEFAGDQSTTEEEYVRGAVLGHDDEESKQWEECYREEYRNLQAEIAARREDLEWTVKQELRDAWHRYFLAPEDMIVIFEGEIIQGRIP